MFLTPKIGATAKVSNCLFDGVVKERRSNTEASDFGAFIHTIDVGSQTVSSPVIEDCVISVAATTDYNRKPFYACVANMEGATNNTVAQRVLVLNNSWAMSGMATPDANIENCYYPAGYLKQIYDNTGHPQPDARAKATADMTEVPFFTGTGFDKWTQQAHHFPMLATFAETAYGKLISLPVMTSESNSLDNINYLLDFVPGPNTVSWQTTDNTAVNIDTDVNVLEPLTASSQIWVVRSMDEDDGTMSAWYVFSQLGFYPVCVGTDRYELFTPLFPRATLHLKDGDVRIRRCADKTTRITVDGRPLEGRTLTHEALSSARRIRFE